MIRKSHLHFPVHVYVRIKMCWGTYYFTSIALKSLPCRYLLYFEFWNFETLIFCLTEKENTYLNFSLYNYLRGKTSAITDTFLEIVFFIFNPKKKMNFEMNVKLKSYESNNIFPFLITKNPYTLIILIPKMYPETTNLLQTIIAVVESPIFQYW